MGYTHYWERPLTLNQGAWERFMEVNRRLLAALPEHSTSAGGYYKDDPLVLHGPEGDGDPELAGDAIAFNGSLSWDGSCCTPDLGHEGFSISREDCDEWHFCKTARKPYDLSVCLVLLNLKWEFGETVTVSSDGDAPDWAPSVDLYEAITERPIHTLAGPWQEGYSE